MWQAPFWLSKIIKYLSSELIETINHMGVSSGIEYQELGNKAIENLAGINQSSFQ